MHSSIKERQIYCPYCGESFSIVIDCSGIDSAGGSQSYIEDCYVCCRPIIIDIETDATSNFVNIETRREDE